MAWGSWLSASASPASKDSNRTADLHRTVRPNADAATPERQFASEEQCTNLGRSLRAQIVMTPVGRIAESSDGSRARNRAPGF
jgi:hypothetical protein